jgi:hypothetical protein
LASEAEEADATPLTLELDLVAKRKRKDEEDPSSSDWPKFSVAQLLPSSVQHVLYLH